MDFEAITNTENPVNAFIVPANVNTTGFSAVDASIAASLKADNNHTLKGQDWNNVAPRIGLAWSPGDGKTVVRGGYGIFYDRPSAAFINTVFSNYPFLREQEVTFPASAVPFNTAWSQQDANFPFDSVPAKPHRPHSLNGTYQIRDNTNVIRGADGTLNPVDPATGLPTRGNIAETFEFRAVDRNLHTPYVQQYNFGVQRDLGPQHDARGSLRRQQGHRPPRGTRLQSGIRLELDRTRRTISSNGSTRRTLLQAAPTVH